MIVRSAIWSNKNFTTGSSVNAGLPVDVFASIGSDSEVNCHAWLPQRSLTDAVVDQADVSAAWSVAEGAFSATVIAETSDVQCAESIAADVNSCEDAVYCVDGSLEDSADCLINKELAEVFTITVNGIIGDSCSVCDAVEPESGHLAVPAGGKGVGRIICIKKQQFNL